MRHVSDISDIQCGYKCFQISTSQVGAPLLAGRTHHAATPALVRTAGRGLASATSHSGEHCRGGGVGRAGLLLGTRWDQREGEREQRLVGGLTTEN